MIEREIFNAIETLNELYGNLLKKKLENLGLVGLGSSHCFILETLLRNNGKLTMSEISSNVNRTKSTCTQLINKLEAYKLVSRAESSTDKRCTNVELTDRSKNLCSSFNEMQTVVTGIVANALTESEQFSFIRMMDKLDFQLRLHIPK